MLTVIKENAKPLKQIAAEVEADEDVSELLNGMWEAMYANRGIGLAANQVGELKRVIVIHTESFKQEFINPVITKRYGGKKTTTEGCLSYPGKQVKMSRYKRVIIEGFDNNWNPVKRKLSGIAAVCAQHEVDHLDGRTIA